jgi:hypothetical protein
MSIEKGKRQAIQTILSSMQWKEAMRSSSGLGGHLDTPMRMLIRKYPDLAETVLDQVIRILPVGNINFQLQCYKEKHNLGEGTFVDMNFEFIEDSFNYR